MANRPLPNNDNSRDEPPIGFTLFYIFAALFIFSVSFLLTVEADRALVAHDWAAQESGR